MYLSPIEYLFLVCLAIQLVFWAYFFRLPLHHKKESLYAKTPGVSIVVCAHNAYHHLTKLIPLLKAQNYPDFEIIIVDDRSNDETASLQRDSQTIKWIKITEEKPGINPKKQALAQGIQNASKEFILVTDADCRPASVSWIQSMVGCLNNSEGIVLGISPYHREVNNTVNEITQFDTSYTAIQYLSGAIAGFPYMGLGRNMLYHRSLFETSKLIQQHGNKTGGDDDLLINSVAHKTNTSICLDPKSFCYTFPEKKLNNWFKQKKRHLGVSHSYNLKSKSLLGLLNFSHLTFHVIFFLNGSFWAFSWLILAGFLLRTSILFSTFGLVSKSVGGQLRQGSFIFIDLIYPFYLFALGGYATVFKTNRWK